MASELKLSSPWINYVKEIHALFERDPEIRMDYNEVDNKLTLYIRNAIKAEAIQALLPTSKVFGNVTLTIDIVPSNNSDSKIDLLKRAFFGNPVVTDFIEFSIDPVGFNPNYVLFEKRVVQYYNDDLSDANRVRSTLYADIAKDVFEDVPAEIKFCTDINDPDPTILNAPLGEWP